MWSPFLFDGSPQTNLHSIAANSILRVIIYIFFPLNQKILESKLFKYLHNQDILLTCLVIYFYLIYTLSVDFQSFPSI